MDNSYKNITYSQGKKLGQFYFIILQAINNKIVI